MLSVLLSVVLNGLVQGSMKEENIERMKVLDDDTVAKDVDGVTQTRDVVHYVGKIIKATNHNLL